ncbi:MAG: UDP-N-acetylmuramoyl-tripeptide--D-alanyl-D-alanine ligase [Oscillospiraceae bacterium]|nr:UDP-N-acetylmuramoyl-tripeptide--D-alanyl-D-alanine ligase [Oscillospiraceae bacterium]
MRPILLSHLLRGIAVPAEDCMVTSVITDSRRATENSVFLAIRGERVNGENYAASAVEKGACFVLTENYIDNVPGEKQAVVPNVLDASIQLGTNVRNTFDIDVIGVTGSMGKTTTKDFIYAAISPFAPTVRTQGNRNNELGMPNTIYSFTEEDRYAVLEMGMEALGDVHKLSVSARPVAAVITCIGISHLERLKTRENILKAKLEMCDGMPRDGVLVLNGDDDYLPYAQVSHPANVVYFAIDNTEADVVAKDIRQVKTTTYFTICDKKYGDIPCRIPAVGDHNVRNALSAYTLVSRMGFDPHKVAENLAGYRASGMRQNFVEKNGVMFIEDCYNAAPASMKAAVDTVKSIADGRAIAVFGDMLELGDDEAELHRSVGEYAKEKGIDHMWTFGERAKHICAGYGDGAVNFATKEELGNHIIANLKKGDSIVFKASHSMRFEDILEQVYKAQE